MPSIPDERERWRQGAAAMRSELFSARTLDANGALVGPTLEAIRDALDTFGAVHVQNTGLTSTASALTSMSQLGFTHEERFEQGGRTSEGWQQKWVQPGLRRLDYYPPDLYLIANNEVQYRRCSTRRVLFYCHRPATEGGRTFLHSAAAVEEGLRAAGPLGPQMLENFARHGLMIETGFLDRRDPRKATNYFQSWQERFHTEDPEEALARASASTLEYDTCWWREEEPRGPRGEQLATLMTRITLSAFKIDPRDGVRYLRFPRIALGAPSITNGYRRYPLGNGQELTDEERELLRSVYLATREGIALHPGDLVLFDNLRYGHSRESFSGDREVYVGMAGELWDDVTEQAQEEAKRERQSAAPSVPRCPPTAGSSHRYCIPPEQLAPERVFSARTFDAGGALDEAQIQAIRGQFSRYGALHVRNTGLRCEHGGALPEEVLRALDFGGDAAFPWGGMSSGRTTRRALSRELRATDDYPQHLWLLPHNEVLYQRTLPARLLFFSATDGPPSQGGRTFVHEARRMESWLRAQGERGLALLGELRQHGLLIEMGFLDERHPAKPRNYFRSWQDRFATTVREEAEARCKASTHQFDDCWWVEDPSEQGSPFFTLMTRIRVPAFSTGPDGGFMLFPRLALDAPAIENGYRRYPLGNGRDFSPEEQDLLLGAFLATREGVFWKAGDLLLVDNLRYGHSREAFQGPRSIGVAMAGEVSLLGPP